MQTIIPLIHFDRAIIAIPDIMKDQFCAPQKCCNPMKFCVCALARPFLSLFHHHHLPGHGIKCYVHIYSWLKKSNGAKERKVSCNCHVFRVVMIYLFFFLLPSLSVFFNFLAFLPVKCAMRCFAEKGIIFVAL